MAYNIQEIIDVTNLIQDPPLTRKTFGDSLILAEDSTGALDRVSEYSTLEELSTDWGTSTQAYKMATAYFSNGLYGKPKRIYVGVHDTSGAETLTEALTAIKQDNSMWYIMCPTNEFDDTALGVVASWIESNDLSFILSINSIDTDIYDSGVTTDIASVLKALDYDRSITNFEVATAGNELYLSPAIMALPATCDFTPSRGAFTLANKGLTGQTSADLTSSNYTDLFAKNANIYTKVTEVNDNVYEKGRMASGQSFDTIQNTDYLKYEMTFDLYEYLKGQPKIAYTQFGINQAKSVIINTLSRMVTAGIIATGYDQAEGRIIENGFEVTTPDISDVTPTQKGTRVLGAVQTRILLAGAIESIVITNYIQI